MWLELLLFPFETKRWLERGINHTKNLRGFKGFVLNHLPVSWLEKKKTNSIKRIEWLASRESNFNTKINASSFHWSLSFMRNRFEFKDRKRLKDKALRVHPSLPFNSSQSLAFHAFSGLKNLWRQIQRNQTFTSKTQSSIDNQTNETESFQCKSF